MTFLYEKNVYLDWKIVEEIGKWVEKWSLPRFSPTIYQSQCRFHW